MSKKIPGLLPPMPKDQKVEKLDQKLKVEVIELLERQDKMLSNRSDIIIIYFLYAPKLRHLHLLMERIFFIFILIGVLSTNCLTKEPKLHSSKKYF